MAPGESAAPAGDRQDSYSARRGSLFPPHGPRAQEYRQESPLSFIQVSQRSPPPAPALLLAGGQSPDSVALSGPASSVHHQARPLGLGRGVAPPASPGFPVCGAGEAPSLEAMAQAPWEQYRPGPWVPQYSSHRRPEGRATASGRHPGWAGGLPVGGRRGSTVRPGWWPWPCSPSGLGLTPSLREACCSGP